MPFACRIAMLVGRCLPRHKLDLEGLSSYDRRHPSVVHPQYNMICSPHLQLTHFHPMDPCRCASEAILAAIELRVGRRTWELIRRRFAPANGLWDDARTFSPGCEKLVGETIWLTSNSSSSWTQQAGWTYYSLPASLVLILVVDLDFDFDFKLDLDSIPTRPPPMTSSPLLSR